MKNIELIVLTANFPYGTGETFFETELPYLSKEFNKVILVPLSKPSKNHRPIPRNCIIHPLSINPSFYSKLLGLVNLFSKIILNELLTIRKGYKKKISRGIIKTLLASYTRSKKIVNEIELLVDNKKKQVFYSYWCEDSAVALSLLKKKNPSIKCITRMHGWDVYFEVNNYNYLPFRSLIASTMNGLFPISEKGKNYINKNWKIGELKTINVARLGVEEQSFHPLPPDVFSIITCSNLIPLKRVEIILKALKEIPDQIKWTHFGDGPLLNSLKNEAKGMYFDFRGRVPNHEVIEFYKSSPSSLFINVSSSEGIPVSIMEAFSFGVPVIASDVGGNNEIVNNQNGTLVKSNITPKELSIEILKYKKMSQEEMVRKRKAAYATWKKNYCASNNYTDFINKIKKL